MEENDLRYKRILPGDPAPFVLCDYKDFSEEELAVLRTSGDELFTSAFSVGDAVMVDGYPAKIIERQSNGMYGWLFTTSEGRLYRGTNCFGLASQISRMPSRDEPKMVGVGYREPQLG